MKRDELRKEVEQIERITNKTFSANTDDINAIVNEKIDVWEELRKALPDYAKLTFICMIVIVI